MFEIEINLDDPEEAEKFVEEHGTTRGRRLANLLGFKGKGAEAAAGALSGYAWNKVTALSCRKRGDIEAARKYEAICDWIYSDDIEGKIKCW